MCHAPAPPRPSGVTHVSRTCSASPLGDPGNQATRQKKGTLRAILWTLRAIMWMLMAIVWTLRVRREGDPGRGGLQGTRPRAGQLGGPASRGGCVTHV
eukprot:4282737-Pyramimonas_sp.AAC.1